MPEMTRNYNPIALDGTALYNIGLDSIDPATLGRYRDSLRARKGGHPWLMMTDEEFVEVIGAAERGADGLLHPTGAGLLMFGREPYISNMYPNYNLDYRERYSAERWTFRLQSGSGEWSGNVFDFFTIVVERLSVTAASPFRPEKITGSGRPDALPAASEAIVNALIHSDYNVRKGVVIKIDQENVIVANPGTFRVPLQDAVRGDACCPRNNRMMKMFSLIGLAEHVGYGVYDLFKSERDGAITDVKIEESRNPSRVTVKFGLSPDNALKNIKPTAPPSC